MKIKGRNDVETFEELVGTIKRESIFIGGGMSKRLFSKHLIEDCKSSAIVGKSLLKALAIPETSVSVSLLSMISLGDV